MKYQRPKVSYNSPEKAEVKSVVGQYRKAREKGEDGIAYTTQPYWYANRLSKRVMADHGVSLREEYTLMSKKEKDYTISVGDGNFKRIQYHSPICRKKVYYRGETPVLKVRDHLQEKYVLADTRYENSKTRYCESCGALIDTTRDYAGCPHCGSAIRIREVHKKIVAIDREMSGDWYQNRLMLAVFSIMLVYGYIAGTVEMVQDGYFEYGIYLGAILYLLLTTTVPVAIMSFLMSVFIGNILFLPIMISLDRSNGRISKVGYTLQKQDPHFSHTEFYGLAQAYMKLWFLSARSSDLGCITEVENCQDASILDVECLGCKGSRVWTDADFTYVSLKLKVRLICAQGEKLIRKRTVCMVTMRRRKGVATTLKLETLKCTNCGASIDMLSDGRCAYCGSKADISSIDWMLCDVKP